MSKTRMTNQRRIILEELRKVDTHPTVDELYTIVKARMPHISLGTVYRNLDLLAEMGEVLKIDSAGSFWGMEQLMQSIPGVIDAESGYANGTCEADADYKTVCKGETGFRETVRVEYDGICEECERKSAELADEMQGANQRRAC